MRLPVGPALLLALWAPAAAGLESPLGVSALEPPSTGGFEVVDRALDKLANHRRLLVVGAHPDDEDNRLLTLVSRAMGGEAAYLSLSRGEGGQNLVGPELGTELGLLRTGELMAAREIEGTRQFFTRAYDFGYTPTLEETERRWPVSVLIEDSMAVVRRFKPQVIAVVFPSDERAGHGQHRMSAVVAEEIFRLSRSQEDPFPRLTEEGLPPWRVRTLYRLAWWDPELATLRLDLSRLDPYTGQSVSQMAAASRSCHRSQDMGRLQEIGPRDAALIWEEGAGGPESPDLFAGVDARLSAIASELPNGPLRERVEALLQAVEEQAVSARRSLTAVRLEEAPPPLAAIVELLRQGLGLLQGGSAAESVAADLLAEKLATAQAGLAAAAGVIVDAWIDREGVVLGEMAPVEAQVWNGGSQPVEIRRVSLMSRAGWQSTPAEVEGGSLGPGELGRWRFDVTVPEESGPTLPYFLQHPLRGDLYDWSRTEPELRGSPWGRLPLEARFELEVAGAGLELDREVVHRRGDQARGEIRRPLRAVPALEVAVEPPELVWPLRDGLPRRLEVTLTSHTSEMLDGRLQIEAPPGWQASNGLAFSLRGVGAREVLEVELRRPRDAAAGRTEVAVYAETAAGKRYGTAYPLVDYSHTRPVAASRPARLELRSVELALPQVMKVGYLRGASDRVPEALLEVGLPLQVLTLEDLEAVRLSGFDVLVIGSRAYESEPELGRVNDRLLDYVRGGGVLIVQYQQYQFIQAGLAPFPLQIARPHDRVTDENSPVRLLDPSHPVFRHPNPIGAEDWEGWVQERGLYFASSWDPAYRPLLALADPGREETQGGLLLAELGRGIYVYTGLSFFRQLPAGVPGAFRLFANLLALAEK